MPTECFAAIRATDFSINSDRLPPAKSLLFHARCESLQLDSAVEVPPLERCFGGRQLIGVI